MTELAGRAYRWPGLDKPEGPDPSLRFLSPPLALAIILVRYSVEAKNFLLILRFWRKVVKEKVKERGEDDAFVTVSDEDEGR